MRLETDRLIIREFTMEDARAVHEYACNGEILAYMAWGPNTEGETLAFVEKCIMMQHQQPRTVYEVAVTLQENGRLIGGISLYLSSHRQGELGYCFNPLYWGQGYATEAAEAMLRFGFEELNLHRIYATCRPSNTGSAKVLERIGMRYEGHLREAAYYKGNWQDSLQYSILRREYMPNR